LPDALTEQDAIGRNNILPLFFVGASLSPKTGTHFSARCFWGGDVAAAFALTAALLLLAGLSMSEAAARPRAREAGIEIGVLPTGPLNAITDVAGVRVGHVTLIEGSSVRTGVTAVLPHAGNLYQDKVPAGFAVANGYGKFMGSTQIAELGEIETPILLTNTLNVPEAAAGIIDWTLRQPGNAEVRSVNAVVGETNDGFLNDIRARPVTRDHALAAIAAARDGPVGEGSVGAGTGTVAFGWKGGIGTSSRRLPARLGGWTVGVLVQANYGGVLSIAGLPVGPALGQYYLRDALESASGDGSVIVVVATDAPLSDRNLERLARRAFLGIARTGSPITNGSGDYAVAFSTHEAVRRTAARREAQATIEELPNEAVSPLFEAVVEATEEAVVNALFAAETMDGHRGRIEALPIDRVLQLRRTRNEGSRS
jgi:D-aminopeptidase